MRPESTREEERRSSDAQSNGQIHKNDKTQMVLTVDDIPGFQISLLADQLPQSVIDLDIMHLIGFLQKYQSTSSNPEQFRSIFGLLQGYQSSCPTLHYIQLIIPWYGATPSIDIKIDSKIGWSAKVQLSVMVSVELVQYIHLSSASTAETPNRGVA